MMNGKGFERKWSWPNLQHYFSTHLEGMSKIKKKKKKNTSVRITSLWAEV
jgi:hypothetical protein